jgi:hypothetical protein
MLDIDEISGSLIAELNKQGSILSMKAYANEPTNLVEATELWFLQSFG